MKRIQVRLLLAVALLISITACDSPESRALKIGVIFPLTGEAASYGEKGREAIEMAVSEVNASGGVNGRVVQAIFEDSRADPATGTSAMQKLAAIDKVPAVIGDIVSAVTLAVAPIAERNKVLLLSPTSSAPAITHAGDFVYRIWPSDLTEGEAIARFAYRSGYRRAAILHINNEYGLSIGQIFKRTFEQGTDARVVSIQSYRPEEQDFRSALSRVRDLKLDAIYLAGYYADSAVILRQARELGLRAQFLGTTAVEDDKFLELAAGAAEGLIYPLATGFDPASPESNVQGFVDGFRSRFGSEPGWVEAQSYEAIMLVIQAARQVDDKITGEALRWRFSSMGEYKGITGKFRFDQNGDVVKPVTIKAVRNGSFQPL